MSLCRVLRNAARRPPSLRTASAFQARVNVRPTCLSQYRQLHATSVRRDGSFTNILADENPPPVQVKAITSEGINLSDGLMIPSACVFLEGKVFLWDVPSSLWTGWTKDHFEIFESVIPRPEILLLGTGASLSQIPPSLRSHLQQLGIQVDVMDTRNACSTYNILAEEGRRVAAALLPISPSSWKKLENPRR